MTEIMADKLNLAAPNGSELFDVSFEWRSPQIVAICSNDTEIIPALAMALRSQVKDEEGQLTIDGEPVSQIRRQVDELISVAGELRLKVRKRLDKWLKHLINKYSDAISWEQAHQLLTAFSIDPEIRLRELTAEQQRIIQVLVPTIVCSPVIMVGQAFDQLAPADIPKVWSLLKDYSRKTNALIIMSSSNVTTMLKWADVVYYFDRGHLTSTRQLATHDSIDCVVTVTGSGFPAATAEKVGAHLLEEAARETRFLFSGNIQALLPLLEQSTITDVRIQDATIDDELLAY